MGIAIQVYLIKEEVLVELALLLSMINHTMIKLDYIIQIKYSN